MIRCPGCGGNNTAAESTCDWCGCPLRETTAPANFQKFLLPIGAGSALLVVAGVALTIISTRGGSAPTPTVSPTVAAVASPAPSPPSAPATVIPTVTPRPAPEAPTRARVTNTNGQGALIRREPSVNAASLGLVAEGDVVTLMGPEETVQAQVWKQVDDGSGNQGWIRADFLQVSEPTAAPVAPVAPVP